MPKLPSKVSSVVAPVSVVKKKVAKKPDTPKVVFKKGVTDIVEVIAMAADLEGVWPKDLIRFSDLRSKYGLPEKISDGVVTRAKLRHREHIRETYAKHSPKKPTENLVEPVSKVKLKIGAKKVSKKKSAVQSVVSSSKSPPPLRGVSGSVIKSNHKIMGKMVKKSKTPQKRG